MASTIVTSTSIARELPEDPWVTSNTAWILAGLTAWSSIFVTCRQIYLHLRFYSNPAHQKWIVRILFMVPIYSFCSWLSLKYYDESIYFDTVRNIYEAFVIYAFLSLMFEYLGGESAILAALKGRDNKPLWLTCTCCMKPFPYGLQFLRFCKQGTLQFCAVKPVMAVVTLATVSTKTYADGDFRADRGYLYVTIIYNVSISIALFALLLFYAATHDLLAPYQPVLKFFIVKAVIFFAFWQGVALAVAEKIGWLQNSKDIESGELAIAYQDFIICLEMLLASIGLVYGFPYTDYISGGRHEGHHTTGHEDGGAEGATPTPRPKSVASNLKNTLNPKDVIDDTIRNFSSTYKKYAKASMHLDQDGSAAVDVDDEGDVSSTPGSDDDATAISMQPGLSKKRMRGSKKGYKTMRMGSDDEAESLT